MSETLDLDEADRMAALGEGFVAGGALVHRLTAAQARKAAGNDVAIGDTFARAGEAEPWEVTCRRQGGADTALFTLERGASMRLATGTQLLDTAQWARVRAL